MNILLQAAGVVVMIVIFIFYFYDRKAAVKSNKLFLYQGLAIFASAVIDIFSLVSLNIDGVASNGMSFSFLTHALCRTYVVTCMLVAYLGLFYVLNDTYMKRKWIWFYRILGGVMFIAGVIVAYTTTLEITYDPNGLNDFTGGIPVTVTYIETFILMGITLAIAIVKRKMMYKKRFIGVCIFLVVWTLGASIQGLVNYVFAGSGVTILSVSFAEAMGSLVIYMMLENPSLNIDRVTGALTQRAFEDYLDICYKKKLKKGFVLIDYDNQIATSIIGDNQFSKIVADMLREFNAEKIFRNDDNNFIVVRDSLSPRALSEAVEIFKEQIYKRNNIKSEIPFKIIHYEDISLFYDRKDILSSINYLLTRSKSHDQKIIEVNKALAYEIHKKFQMDQKCDVAFSKRSFEVFYQPIYSNLDLSFTAAEALVRLKDDDGNLIYPSDFIEEMEKDGRIIELGRLVFENVCEFISKNNMEALGLHYIEVNLSAVQCMQENLAVSFIEIMERYNVDPKYINLEITETAQSTRNILIKNMKILRDYGVSFSLDDFGTGNSNLNYIVEMPVEIVKFDKNMVNSYFENRIASYVMNSTIDMIKGLGHKIVFEGIEEELQINQVRSMKVDYVQGYFYSKPIDQYAFVEFIVKYNKIVSV